MATGDYTLRATLKTRLGIADTNDDALLDGIITMVSREIDGECDDWFYPITETRYYSPTVAGHVSVDSLQSLTALKTDEDGDGVFEVTWATTDYLLAPYNASKGSIPGRPYWRIEVAPNGRYAFPVGRRTVEAAGSWGAASTTPSVVEAACLFQCALEYHAKDAPGGVSGAGEFETPVRAAGLHPFTRRMLAPYRRLVVA